jgi:hypothetical protein
MSGRKGNSSSWTNLPPWTCTVNRVTHLLMRSSYGNIGNIRLSVLVNDVLGIVVMDHLDQLPCSITLPPPIHPVLNKPIQRMFFALAANLGYSVYGGDAQDAYAHSPPPETPTFVQIDDAYAEWYFARYNIQIDRKLVLPVQHALQGHPESGRLWEATINRILSSTPLQFKSTTHSRTIYSTTFDGHQILLLRQVEDFALACPTESIAKKVYDIIGKALQLPQESTPPFKFLGLITDFNGVDVNQDQGYIEIAANSYISRFLKSHGWDTPNTKESESDMIAPLPMDSVDAVYKSDPGPRGNSCAF